jgi:hypothetical protein
MNAFIFVSIVCVGQTCNFVSSNKPIEETKCQVLKTNFLAMPFKTGTTLAAAQCMEFESDNNLKVKT